MLTPPRRLTKRPRDVSFHLSDDQEEADAPPATDVERIVRSTMKWRSVGPQRWRLAAGTPILDYRTSINALLVFEAGQFDVYATEHDDDVRLAIKPLGGEGRVNYSVDTDNNSVELRVGPLTEQLATVSDPYVRVWAPSHVGDITILVGLGMGLRISAYDHVDLTIRNAHVLARTDIPSKCRICLNGSSVKLSTSGGIDVAVPLTGGARKGLTVASLPSDDVLKGDVWLYGHGAVCIGSHVDDGDLMKGMCTLTD